MTLGSIVTAVTPAAAVHRHPDQPAAGLAVHLGLGQFLLRLHQLLLDLLRLGQQRRHVELVIGLHDSPLRVGLDLVAHRRSSGCGLPSP